MKIRQLITSIALLCGVTAGWSQSVDLQTAQTLAEHFYSQQFQQKKAHALRLYVTEKGTGIQKSADAPVRYYIFNDDSNGFVIVSGDMRFPPVLGYSTQGGFDTAGMPENIRWWLQEYSNQMEAALARPEAAMLQADPMWKQCLDNSTPFTQKSGTAVSPLIRTQWGQGYPFNDSCPYDENAYKTNYHSPAGCVATAMAQILKFWNWPAKGIGFRTYYASNYSTQHACFEKASYDWSNMTNSYSNSSSIQEKRAVAQLMYHCGVSVEMSYGTNSSGAYTYLTDYQMTTYNYTDARTALMRCFGCDTVLGFKRNDYTDSNQWINMLKTELDAGRPILYSGSNPKSGHAFVCDGYDTYYGKYYFHINWGWTGTSDGYFFISALDPINQGTGGSESGYNMNQNALFVRPNVYPASTLCDLQLYAPMHISSNPVTYNTAFYVSDSIANYDTESFDGYIGVMLYNENGRYIGVAGKTALKLNSYYFHPDFQCELPAQSNLTEGNYIARLAYTTSNDRRWHLVGDKFFDNNLRFSVKGGASQTFKLHLYSPLRISKNPVEYNTSFYFTDSIINSGGTEAFKGYIGIAIYDSASNFKGLFGSQSISLNSGYFLTSFRCTVPENNGLPAGSYTAALAYSTDADQKWYLIAGDIYPNQCSFRITKNQSSGSDLQLGSQISISQSPVSHNSAFNFTAVVSNKGGAAFNGYVAMALFDAKTYDYYGAYGAQNISLSGGYSVKMQFNIPSGNNLPKGSYIAMMIYSIGSDQQWDIVSGGQYSNQFVFRITDAVKYTLTVISANQKMGSAYGGCEFYGDTTRTIYAVQNPGYHFTGWKDGITDNPRFVTVCSDTVFIAQFAAGDAIAGHEAEQLCIYAGQREIIVKNAEGQPLQLFDLTGRLLGSIEAIAHAEQHLPVQAPGVYIVRIGNDRMQKIVVP